MTDMLSLQDIVNELDGPREREPGIRRVVVAGEFESGKSSVINALLGKIAVPCNPGLPGRPVVKVNHSLHTMIFAEDKVGNGFQVETMEQLNETDNLAICDIRTSMPGMTRIEFVEVPHHPGKGILPADAKMMAEADLVIWVTISSQAWRLSEKSLIESMPELMRERCVLAVSRADHLRYVDDWEKIETRLQKEASPYFAEMVFIQASIRNLKACRQEEQAWIRTGGPTLASIIHDLTTTRRSTTAGEAA